MANHYADDLKVIKKVCNIPNTNTDFDDELRAALRKAYNLINIMFERWTTVPLTGTDITEMLKDIEADIAAGYYKEQKVIAIEGERTSIHIFRKRGMDALKEYIKTKFEAVGQTTTRTTAHIRHIKDDRRMHIDGTDDDI